LPFIHVDLEDGRWEMKDKRCETRDRKWSRNTLSCGRDGNQILEKMLSGSITRSFFAFFEEDSKWTASGQQVDSKWTASGQQVDSHLQRFQISENL
jgi:hypothetical protein